MPSTPRYGDSGATSRVDLGGLLGVHLGVLAPAEDVQHVVADREALGASRR